MVLFSPLNSVLLKKIKAKFFTVFLSVTAVATSVLAAGLIVQSLVEANREIWSHAMEIRAMLSTVLWTNKSSIQSLDGFLSRYKLQHNEEMRDGINYIIVIDKFGRIVLSSRRAWDQLLVTDTMLMRTESNDQEFSQIRNCFIQDSASASSDKCFRVFSSFYNPFSASYTFGGPLRTFSRDKGLKSPSYLVLINFDPSVATSGFALQATLVSFGSLVFILLVLSLFSFCLYRSLVPVVRSFAEIDPLTGLINRGACMSLGIELLVQPEKTNLPYSVAILDLDHFKSINDTYGHQCGDYVLREVALTLEQSLHGNDLVARLGGEEFIVMAQCSSAHALLVMERLRNEIEQLALSWEGRILKVTLSIGLTSTEQLGYNLNHLYAEADSALYRAKDQGRNRICLSSSSNHDICEPWSPGQVWSSSFSPLQSLDAERNK